LGVLKAGTAFAGRYEIVRIISAGGMGAVYEVVHLETRRRRALKVMLPSALADDDMRQRFRREASVTATVESEHIVEVFDAGVDAESESPFLVMELLRGEDIGARMRDGGRMQPAEVLDVFSQIARGLDKTHAAGIVHRDLKPENVFLTKREDGTLRVKILDFGIAKLVSRTQGKSTRSLGTPLFMAPEQVSGVSSDIGPAADLYALAQLTFAVLVGRPYFFPEGEAADNVLSLLFHIAKGASDPATVRAAQLGVALPPRFDAWFRRASHLDPRERFASAGEMIEALRDALEGGVAALTAAPSTPTRRAQVASAPTLPLSESDKDVRVAPLAKSIEVDERTATQASASASTNNVGDSIATGPPPSSRTLADVKRSSGPRWGILAVGGAAVGVVVAFALTRPDDAPQPSREATAAVTETAPGGAPPPDPDPTVTPVTDAVASTEPAAPPPSAAASATASAAAAPSATSPVVSGGQRRTAPTGTAAPVAQPTAGPTVWSGPRK
jgi:eukaryotic-like serine/threonine-protein kinase